MLRMLHLAGSHRRLTKSQDSNQVVSILKRSMESPSSVTIISPRSITVLRRVVDLITEPAIRSSKCQPTHLARSQALPRAKPLVQFRSRDLGHLRQPNHPTSDHRSNSNHLLNSQRSPKKPLNRCKSLTVLEPLGRLRIRAHNS